MAFTLNPSNQAISLAEFNTLGNDFVRFFKTTVQTFAASIFIPGTTQGNGQGNGAFTNKAIDYFFKCPPNCKKVVAVKDRLALP
jgi:hypothetical protein